VVRKAEAEETGTVSSPWPHRRSSATRLGFVEAVVMEEEGILSFLYSKTYRYGLLGQRCCTARGETTCRRRVLEGLLEGGAD